MKLDHTFLESLGSSGEIQIDPVLFSIDLLLVVAFTWVLGKFYARYAKVLSNRVNFARNFIPVGIATMFLISIIKSSLALSLGLVGALSIVRFRAAIKEPEELSYLFLSIAIGVGMGAGQRPLTVLTFVIVIAVLYVLYRWDNPETKQGLYLSLSGKVGSPKMVDQVSAILAEHCRKVKLRKWHEFSDHFEASFIADFKDFKDFIKSKDALKALDQTLHIGLVDSEGLI